MQNGGDGREEWGGGGPGQRAGPDAVPGPGAESSGGRAGGGAPSPSPLAGMQGGWRETGPLHQQTPSQYQVYWGTSPTLVDIAER